MKKVKIISLLACMSLLIITALGSAISVSAAEEPRFDAATGTTYLDSMDDPSIYNEDDRKPNALNEISKDGTSITVTGSHAWIKRDYSPNVNVNATRETGVVKFWLYIENPEALTNIWFHIISNDTQTAANGADKCLMKFEADKFKNEDGSWNLESGWNEVTLNLNNPTEHRNTLDLSHISYTHFEYESSEDITVYMDDLRIVDPSKATGNTDNGDDDDDSNTDNSNTDTDNTDTDNTDTDNTDTDNTDTDNTDTGVDGFAFAVLAIVVLAGAAVVVSKKRSSVK